MSLNQSSSFHVAATRRNNTAGPLCRRIITRQLHTPLCSPRKAPGPQAHPGLQCIKCSASLITLVYDRLDSAES